MSHPTPDISHLTSRDFENVYEPAEDTFLFLDALSEDLPNIVSRSPRVCMEIGSGSGCVITFLAQIVGANNAVFLASDINPKACLVTQRTARQNKVSIDVIRTSFASGLLPRLQKGVDILLFNPPYVVTPSEEVGSHGVEAAWAGGIDGREVIDQFLPVANMLLSDSGMLYMVLLSENKPDEVAEIMYSRYSMASEVIMRRKSGWEHLHIVRFSRLVK